MQEEKIFEVSFHPIPQLGEQEGDQALAASIQVNQESPWYSQHLHFIISLLFYVIMDHTI